MLLSENKRTVIDFRRRNFVQVTRDIIDKDTKLTKPVDIAVYTVLCMYADNETKEARPSVATIAEKARTSERTVRRSLQALKDAGYIDIELGYDSRGLQSSNKYYLLDIPAMSANGAEFAATQNIPTFEKGLGLRRKPKWVQKIILDFGGECALGGPSGELTLDHVIPRRGSKNMDFAGNIIPLSATLNSSKGNRNLFEWYPKAQVRFGLDSTLFYKMVRYLSKQMGMTAKEYEEFYSSEYEDYIKERAGKS